MANNTILFSNNAQTVLASGITNVATSLTVSAGTGSQFPNPGAGQYFVLTLVDAATGLITEIMWCTARVGDVLTVTRGQEGTTARAWNAADIVGNFWTAGEASAMFQNNTNNPLIAPSMQIFGSASGTITLQPQAAAGTYNWNYPITAGASGAPLLSGGGGATAMSWGSVTGSGNFVLSASPTLTGTITAASMTVSGDISTSGGFGGVFSGNNISSSIANGGTLDVALPTGWTNGAAVGKFWSFKSGGGIVASTDFVLNAGAVPVLVNNGGAGGLTLTAITANNIRLNNNIGSASTFNWSFLITGHP